MGTISLTLPTAGTVIAAGLHATNYSTLQALANGGIDNNNFATGRIFDNTKLMQGGALDKQALIWNNGAVQWQPAYPPGYQYDYAHQDTDVAVTATTEGTANTVVTGASVTYDGATAVWVEFFAPRAQIGTTVIRFWLYDNGASIGQIGRNDATAGVSFRVRITPSAAAHTYSVRASVDGGSGLVNAGAGGAGVFYPAFIRVSKA